MLRVENTSTHEHEASYLFDNIDASIVNGLRRILLSEIPHIAMDHETISNTNTVIQHNTSCLHNELIINRLALTPLNNDHPLLTIYTHWNSENSQREFSFSHPELLPKVSLDVIHDVKAHYTSKKMLPITLENSVVMFTPEQKSSLTNLGYDHTVVGQNFFVLDPITSEHCLLLKLKPASSEDDFQRIALTARPIIGTGADYASFVQVGTVMYEHVRLGEKEQTEAFNAKMKKLNEERMSKDMSSLTDEKKQMERVTFNILDAQRVFSKNERGEPNLTKLTIQSINSKSPNQLLYDALQWFVLKIHDFGNVLRTMSYISKHPADIEENDKATWIQSQTQLINACELDVAHETHTLGALMSAFCKHLYVDENTEDTHFAQCLDFMSYNMPHPLKKHIRFRFKLNEEKLASVYSHLSKEPELAHPTQQRNRVCALLLLRVCEHITKQLNKMSEHLQSVDPQILGTSYIVKERESIIVESEAKKDDQQ